MKNFEFYFDGKIDDESKVECGIKILRGEAVDIALALGTYADRALKQLNQPQTAIIVLNAFKRFMELNPNIQQQVIDALVFQDGARIVRPDQKDIFNVNPKSAFRKN